MRRRARFRSMHDCFTRRLKDGARPIDMDPDILVSPCDAIVGAAGESGRRAGAAGEGLSRMRLDELLGDDEQAAVFRDGCYVTLRLTSSMYHRFHAPHDCRVESVTHIGGDTWNVNPIALKRVERLYLQERTGGDPDDPDRKRTAGDPGGGCRDPGSRHPAAVPGDAARPPRNRAGGGFPATCRFAKARKWAGSSTDRRSSCLRPGISGWRATWLRARRSASGNRLCRCSGLGKGVRSFSVICALIPLICVTPCFDFNPHGRPGMGLQVV